MQRDYDLSDILNVPKWEPVQDQLARVTGTAIITVDYRGTPITKHSCRTGFCSVIRENPVSRKRCYKCDALAGLEAVRMNRPFIYLCHCGIVDVAVPVLVGDKYLGAVMFGQVRIKDGQTEGKVERLVSEISSFQPESEQARRDLLELYDNIPEMEYERVVEIADMIASVVEYIVRSAVDSKTQALTYEWMLRSAEPAGEYRDLRGLAHMEELPPREERAQGGAELPVGRSSPVYPAVLYIENHPRQAVTMQEMADLCKISSSYFSRLFQRDVGESFKDHVNRRKVEAAKAMLSGTDYSVSHIAYELGFLDPSYFVKIFKKYEGITPLIYRQHKYR